MVKRFKYYARGLVLVVYDNGTRGTLPMVEYEADTYVELMGVANVLWLENRIASVVSSVLHMRIKDTIGAVLDIKQRTYIEVDDENFVSSKLMFDSVGNLSMSEYEMLQGELLFKYKGK
jgi:hypothetical protein